MHRNILFCFIFGGANNHSLRDVLQISINCFLSISESQAMNVNSDGGAETSGDLCGIDGIDLSSPHYENQLLMVSDEDSESSLMLKTLIYDCLYEAFKRLNFIDLINVVKVCTRFEAPAKSAFVSKYKNIELDLQQCNQETMANILSVFGSYIQSLEINLNQHAPDADLLRAIIQLRPFKLKTLGLIKFEFREDAMSFRLSFPELSAILLEECSGNLNLAHLVGECTNLEQIALVKCNLQGVNVNQMISRRFEKIEELHMVNCNFDVKTDVLEHFIVSNLALTKLFLITSEIGNTRAIRLIGENLLKLQHLHLLLSFDNFQDFQSDVKYLGRLRSLSHLSLDFQGLEVAPLATALAANNVPIKFLMISDGLIDDIAIDAISELRQITSLSMSIVNGLNEEHLTNLARNLPKIEVMFLRSDVLTIDVLMEMLHHAKQLSIFHVRLADDTVIFSINEDHYVAMVDTIRKRPEKRSVRIEIGGKNVELNAPDAMLQQNTDLLSIEVHLNLR